MAKRKEPFLQRGGNPCYGCHDRHIACSDHCQKPEFLDWKAEQEKIKKNRREYNVTTDYVRGQIQKNRRKR